MSKPLKLLLLTAAICAMGAGAVVLMAASFWVVGRIVGAVAFLLLWGAVHTMLWGRP